MLKTKKTAEDFINMLENKTFLESERNDFFNLYNEFCPHLPLSFYLKMESNIPKEMLDEHEINLGEVIAKRTNEIKLDITKPHSRLSIIRLLEIEFHFPTDFFDVHKVDVKTVIDKRIDHLNELVQDSFPGYLSLNRATFNNWFQDIDIEKITGYSSLNLLANIAKEIPPYAHHYEVILECFISRINNDKSLKYSIGNIARNDAYFDQAIELLRSNIIHILSQFDINYKIYGYLKRILVRTLLTVKDEKTISEFGNEQEDLEIYSIVTLSLVILSKLKFKPHMKIIFWHEKSYYIFHKAIKQIDHQSFIDNHRDDSLGELFELTMEKLTKYLYKLDESEDFTDSLNGRPSDVILPQFDEFRKVLDELFINLYTEPVYEFLRDKLSEIKIASIKLITFFEDQNGVIISPEEIRDKISQWNFFIRKELKKIKNELKEAVGKRRNINPNNIEDLLNTP